VVQPSPWQTGQGGVLTLNTGELRLVVKVVSGLIRFMVLRPPTGAAAGPEMLLGSGTGDSVHSAMAAAERMAARCSCRGHKAPASNGRA
jgi:hypothetical protein